MQPTPKTSWHILFSFFFLFRNTVIDSFLQEGQGLVFEGERRLLEYRLKNETVKEITSEGTNVLQVSEERNLRVWEQN